jgi:hypothetical protein
MDLPNNLAAKTLLLEKSWNLERQLGEEHFVIWAGKRQTRQVIAPCANASTLNIRHSYRNDSQLFIHRPISRICFMPELADMFHLRFPASITTIGTKNKLPRACTAGQAER